MLADSLPPSDPDSRERLRKDALDEFAIMDTHAETAYDDIARLARAICGTPIAVVSLVDSDRQWFKARVGTELTSTPRAISFCDHAIRTPDRVMQVSDAAQDQRFADSPLVNGELDNLCFYAGAPILAVGGEAIGTVCVMDRVPRSLNQDQLEGLAALARQVGLLLELRLLLNTQREANARREGMVQRLHSDREALQRSNEDLDRVAHHDALTGLLNRAGLERLRHWPDAANRLAEGTYVMAMLDIDHFKHTNDRHGHLAGDQVLRRVADVIRSSVRKTDAAARFGGEEFLLVFPQTSLARAYEIAERIRCAVEEDEAAIPVTVSIGLATGDPAQDRPEAVVERADQALYRAKTSGRNRVVADDTPRL